MTRDHSAALRSITEAGGVVKVQKPKGKLKREDQKAIITWHAPEVHKQLGVLAAETEKTRQELVSDALNMLFLKFGKPPIA